MREHLIKTGADEVKEPDTMTRTPHLHQWCRSTSGVLMQLTNGTVQVCNLTIYCTDCNNSFTKKKLDDLVFQSLTDDRMHQHL